MGEDKARADITMEDLASITDLEITFGTTRLLPDWEDIPEKFKTDQNIYVKLVDALFYNHPLPAAEVAFRSGFDADGTRVIALQDRLIMACLTSFEPRHEHKIAGLAYLISQICELRES